jgi:hypothetical protein
MCVREFEKVEMSDRAEKGIRTLSSVPKVCEIKPLGCEIWVSATSRVVQPFVLITQSLDVFWYHFVLVLGAREVVAKSTTTAVQVSEYAANIPARAICRFLRLKVHCSTNSGDVWARSREIRLEFVCVVSIVGEASVCAADTAIA